MQYYYKNTIVLKAFIVTNSGEGETKGPRKINVISS